MLKRLEHVLCETKAARTRESFCGDCIMEYGVSGFIIKYTKWAPLSGTIGGIGLFREPGYVPVTRGSSFYFQV